MLLKKDIEKSFNIRNKKKLFIFELANNHNGSIANGFKLVQSAKKISKSTKINFAIKLQFRDLKTFLYKKNRVKNKHIDRFKSAKLSENDYTKLCKYIKKNNFTLVITPFDEPSVKKAVKNKVDILKIASCSNTDWPLIEKIAQTKKPVICSTGGLDIDGIDNICNFFSYRKIPLAILHCISVYPTDNLETFNLNFIKRLQSRYPNVVVGYSGHERESNFLPVLTASSLGARIFERHFSTFETRNKYSADSKNLKELIKQLNDNIKLLGHENKKIITKEEVDSLNQLRRGVFVKSSINKNTKNLKKNVYFAFPKINKKQLEPGDLGKTISISKKFKKDEALVTNKVDSNYELIRKYVHRYKYMLNEANVVISKDCRVELSHHNGIENLEKVGALLVTLINGQYCKKVIALFPGQRHPKHKHFKKVETFHILSGDLQIIKANKVYNLSVGDKLDVFKDEWHSFSTLNGAVFEEISTESIKTDSKYFDPVIDKTDSLIRKTFVPNW